ncbi:hypothetical protein [Herbiconiux sp.]|jgi:hypothetical protein|uniref:hypothetical protein n=1 Tax=Herbiconiux sp. TaxID=1871186 RepID=UPI0025C14CA1|nr:hypothetical protein [Herbiconiux sp.]
MPAFLVEYNRRSREVRVQEFDGPSGHRDALLRRIEIENEREDGDWEIASLNADSLETIRRTHSRYFDGSTTALLAT